MVVAVATNRLADGIERIARTADHGVDAQVELAVVGHRQVNLGFGEIDARIVHARDALGEQGVVGGPKRGTNVVLAGLRHVHLDEVHRQVDQDARRPAILVADDLAADRIRGVVVDTGERHGGAVGPARVAVGAAQPDRPVGDHRIDIARARERIARPQDLVPAAPDDPGRRGLGLGVCGDARHGRIEARRAVEIQRVLQVAVAVDVSMRVDQSGQDGLPVAIDVFRTGVLFE